jgi:DNA repair ATPase RecN
VDCDRYVRLGSAAVRSTSRHLGSSGIGSARTTALGRACRLLGHNAQVLALDGLARLAAAQGDTKTGRSRLTEADQLARVVVHTLDEQDRIDARLARDRLAAG